MKSLHLAAAAALLAASASAARADTLWGVNASAGDGIAEEFSLTGKVLQQIDLGAGIDPRGIALVGNTAYFSNANDGFIRSFNTLTGVVSSAKIATGHAAYGSLSWDGTGLWANDYEGGNQAYHITLSGAIDKTVTLADCGSYCNAIDFTAVKGLPGGGTLLVNRGETESSATYDLYDAAGNLILANALTNVTNGAGAAGDAANGNLYVSDALDGQVLVYNNRNLIDTITLGGPAPNNGYGQHLIADLAVGVPEPASMALLAGSAAGLAALRRRRA